MQQINDELAGLTNSVVIRQLYNNLNSVFLITLVDKNSGKFTDIKLFGCFGFQDYGVNSLKIKSIYIKKPGVFLNEHSIKNEIIGDLYQFDIWTEESPKLVKFGFNEKHLSLGCKDIDITSGLTAVSTGFLEIP